MDYTTNKNLAKPTENETYDLATVNENMDKIDAALKTNDDAITQLTEKMIILNDERTGAVNLVNGATNTAFGNNNKVVKKGKLVTLDLALNLDNATTTMYQSSLIGQLPAGFEPASSVISQVITRAKGFCLVEVNTSGAINIQRFDQKESSQNTCLLHLSWIAKN